MEIDDAYAALTYTDASGRRAYANVYPLDGAGLLLLRVPEGQPLAESRRGQILRDAECRRMVDGPPGERVTKWLSLIVLDNDEGEFGRLVSLRPL
jgi:hypothetical protein